MSVIPQLRTFTETRERLGISPASLYTLCRKGEIPYIRLRGWDYRFSDDAIAAWLVERAGAPNSKKLNAVRAAK